MQAEGAANANELAALILDALAEARGRSADDANDGGGATPEPPAVEREVSNFEAGGSPASMLPSTLRRLGKCLLLIDHIEVGTSGAAAAGMMSLLQVRHLPRSPPIHALLKLSLTRPRAAAAGMMCP